MSPSIRGAFAAAVMVLLLPACGGREEKQEKSLPTITFWHSFVATTVPAFEDLLAEFRREHPGIQINAHYLPTGDGLIQKLVSAVQSRTTPDIAWVHTDFLDKHVVAIKRATLGKDDPKACLDEAVARANEKLSGK